MPGSAEQEFLGAAGCPMPFKHSTPTGCGGFLVALHDRTMGRVGGPAGGRTPLVIGADVPGVRSTTAPVSLPLTEEPWGTEHPFPALLFADTPRTEAKVILKRLTLKAHNPYQILISHGCGLSRLPPLNHRGQRGEPLAPTFSHIDQQAATSVTALAHKKTPTAIRGCRGQQRRSAGVWDAHPVTHPRQRAAPTAAEYGLLLDSSRNWL